MTTGRERPDLSKSEIELNKDEFDNLLAHLDPDRDRAGEKYLTIWRKLVKFFEGRKCLHPEEHADDTMSRIARQLTEGKPIDNISTYAIGVARMIMLEIYSKQKKERLALNQMAASQPDPEDQASDNRRFDCFDICMKELTPEDRELISQYYDEEKYINKENRKRLAEQLGIPLNALRIRAYRIRLKLEVCIDACLES